MIERPAAAIIGLSARTSRASDLHDVWADRLSGRSNRGDDYSVLSFEDGLYSVIVDAWTDAFRQSAPVRANTFFASFGNVPVDRHGVCRVMNRIGPQLAEPPSTDSALDVLYRATAAAAHRQDTAFIVVLVDAFARGAVLILEAREQAARRHRAPYALVEFGGAYKGLRFGDPQDLMAIVDAVLAVAYGTVPPRSGQPMRPWLANERVALIGERGAIKQWCASVLNRNDAPPTQTLIHPLIF
jgi:hypothetical protein